jgi:hypothetical protein
MKVAFGLTLALGALRPGDRVSLQLLYTPDGSSQVPPTTTHAIQKALLDRAVSETLVLPALSNRITFVVTQDMLGVSQRR